LKPAFYIFVPVRSDVTTNLQYFSIITTTTKDRVAGILPARAATVSVAETAVFRGQDALDTRGRDARDTKNTDLSL
jgi:hypothetical protein